MTVRSIRLPSLLLLEILWGWALAAVVAQLFSGGDARGPSVVAVAAIVLGSAGIGAFLRSFDVAENVLRAAGVASMILALFVAVPLDYRQDLTELSMRAGIIGATVVLGALWIRGATRNDPDDLFEPIARSAILGVLPVAVAAATSPDVNGGASFGLVAVIYVPLALLVLAVHQAAEPTKNPGTVLGDWAPFAAAALIAGAGLALVADALAPEGVRNVLSPGTGVLSAIADPIGRYIFGPLFAAIGWLFSFIPSRSNTELQPGPPPDRPPPDKDEDQSIWGEWLSWAAAIIVPLAIVAAVLFILVLLFTMTRGKREDEDDPWLDREEADQGDGSGLFQGFRARFRRKAEPASSVEVRRLYGEVLARAAADGLERPPSVTPLQFAPALDSRYGGTGTDITRAFIESRYGAHDISVERVRELRSRWEAQTRTDGRSG